MKTRAGFVSNSSSTSFCIIGIAGIDLKVDNEILEKCRDDYDMCHSISDDYVYWGRSITKMEDDETLLDFKNKVADELSKMFGVKIGASELEFIEEAGFDG